MDATEASALAAIATVIVTVVLAVLTGFYVVLTHRLVRIQMDPYVVTYVRHDEARPSMMLIVIENVGRGLARDITFVLSKSIPHRAFGIDEASARARPRQEMNRGPLITGIPALGPGDSRKIIWGQYPGLHFHLGMDPVVVTCTYRTQDGQSRETVCVLDIRSFEATDATDPDGARQSAKQLKRIADDLHRGVNDLRRLRAQPPAEGSSEEGGSGVDVS